MRLVRRRGSRDDAAVAAESVEHLRDEIDSLSAANRVRCDSESERRLLHLRHLAAIGLIDAAIPDPSFPDPDLGGLRRSGAGAGTDLSPVPSEQLSPGVVRAGILRDGCVLVRGLVPREDAERFAALIERAYAERDRHAAGEVPEPGYFEAFVPDARFGEIGDLARGWVKKGGGLFAADSPRLSFEMFELFERARLPALMSGYLGEPALISVHKTALRKAEPSVPGAWHQDGRFMGPVRALNLWLSLSDCGREAPGLDIVPGRLDDYVATGTDDAPLSWTVSDRQARDAAARAGVAVIRPAFAPGDALLFDELFLHKTGSDAAMRFPRFAIESWFFGASAFPDDYAPIAV